MRTRVLAVHADYRCRHTGVCCSSAWDIPVEPAVLDLLRENLRTGRLHAAADAPPFREITGLPHGACAVFGHDDRGRCVFLETGRGNLCAIHRQVGEGALPSACRDFPRVVTRTPLGVSITLSHYCPTAARLLFRPPERPPSADASPGAGVDPLLAIRSDAPGFSPGRPYEGLDAREALPPLLRPGVFASWSALARWEEHAVETLARDDLSPEKALSRLGRQVEWARTWTPADGPFEAHFERCLRRTAGPGSASAGGGRRESLGAWAEAVASVPPAHPVPEAPLDSRRDAAARLEELVDAGWAALARPIRRWLAAKAFASWLALQGEGLRTTVTGLRLALGVLRAEALRGCAESEEPMDADGLREAIRRTDLLLVHLVDPTALARRLSRGEASEGPEPPW